MLTPYLTPYVKRFTAGLLVAGQVGLALPVSAQTLHAQDIVAAPAADVPVNRAVPRVSGPSAALRFSDRPTTDELFRARVFAEPLVPVGGEPEEADTRALAHAVTAFAARGNPEAIEPLADYLAQHPSSPWRPSVLTNLAALYRRTGAYTRALEAWDEAWQLAKDDATPVGRALADTAISESLALVVSFGQTGMVEKRLEDLAGRNVRGPAAVRVSLAREIASLISNYSEEVIASGPEAVRVLLQQRPLFDGSYPEALTSFRPAPAGTSLIEVARLANESGLSLRPARWQGATEIPVGAVLHWKLGHFSPIVAREGDRYRIDDVALGGTKWITKSTLLSETSGYFLVPRNASADGWGAVSDAEAVTIIGRSCPPGPSPPVPPPPPPPDKDQCGMPVYSFDAVTASLRIADIPVGYTPARGPEVLFRLNYHQRELLQPQILNYGNAGPKWTMDWLRYVQQEPATMSSPALIWIHMVGGGREWYADLNNDGTSDEAHWRSRAIAVRTSTSPLRYERRLPDGTVEVYAAVDNGPAGNKRIFLTELIDPQGQALEFTWDAQFRLVAVTDALGQVTTLLYEHPTDDLKLTRVTDPFGRSAALQYTEDGQLKSITDVIGLTSSFVYGSGDVISMMTTPYGTTVFENENTDPDWSVYQRVIEATDPLGDTERMEFHWKTSGIPATAPTTQVPAGFESSNGELDHYNTFYWDKKAWKSAPGDLTKAVVTKWMIKSEYAGWPAYSEPTPHSIKLPLEGRVWFQHPGDSGQSLGWWTQPTKVGRKLDDGTSQIWEWTYDTFGNVLTEQDPLGRRTTYTYATNGIDLLDARQTTGGQNQLLASFSNYTAQHRPQTIVDAGGQTTTITYNSAGQPLTVTNPKLETTTLTYDGGGRLATSTGPVAGAVTTFGYDGYGRLRTTTDSDSYTTTTDYDLFDRPTKTTYPDGSYDAWTYDRLDLSSSRDRAGRLTRYYYNALRRLVSTRDPLGRTIRQEWCSCGSPSSLVDAKGQATTWERDLQGRVTREVRHDGSATSYAYESMSSRLHTVTDPKGQVRTYTYFRDDLLASVAYGQADVATPTVSYVYDTIYPRRTSMTDGTGVTTYTYKTMGQVGGGSIASVDGPLANDTLAYTYDQLGRMTSRALNGTTVTWSIDALGRTTSEVNVLGTFTYGFDGVSGRRTSTTYPNGQTTAYSYFGATGDFRVSSIHHQTSGSATISKFDYTYDVVGNIVTWQQALGAAPETWTFRYDAADQLTGAEKRDQAQAILKRYGYVYDSAGNRTTEQIDDAVMGATFNGVNRLVSHQPSGSLLITGQLNEPGTVTVDGKPATVDASNRFVASKAITSGANVFTIAATDVSGNVSSKTYDLTSAGATKTFTYDANGNMTGDGTRTFTWDAQNRLATVESGVKRSEFTYDGDDRRVRIVEKENGVVVRDARLIWSGATIVEERVSTGPVNRFFADGEQHNGAARYLTRDHLGSVREVTDASGTVLTRNDYDPYGRVTRIGGTEDSRFGFTGHYLHGPSGLVLALYRAYDPTLGRWLSEDPAGFIDGPNVHAYVGANPVSFIDALGLACSPPSKPPRRTPEKTPPARPNQNSGNQGDTSGAGVPPGGPPSNPRRMDLAALERYLKENPNAYKEAGVPDPRRLAMKAIDIIAKELKGSVHAEFPKQLYDKTLEQITKLARQGDKAAQTARKLLTDKEYRKR